MPFGESLLRLAGLPEQQLRLPRRHDPAMNLPGKAKRLAHPQ
jgi:hypothetical protein